MKKYIALTLFTLFMTRAVAQDDLLTTMQNEAPGKPTPVYATFKSSRVINLQSNETMKAKHLDFRIQHRFAPLDINEKNVYGLHSFFGLDAGRVRLSLEYGITDRIMVAVGRTAMNNTYDGSVKVKVLQQTTKGSGSFPVSVVYFGDVAIATNEWTDKTRKNLFSSRLSYVTQLIVTRKFNEWFSLSLNPTLVHHNLVPDKSTPNDVFALGVGASVKITRSTRFNIEYVPRLNGRDNPVSTDGSGKPLYYDSFAVGFDIETGGHVFQLHLTNSQGMIDQHFITQNTNPLDLAQFRFGFNISRTFSFDKSIKERK